MLRPESQSAVDAWLSGDLDPDTAAELESSFEKNSDQIANERRLYEESGLDPALLHRIAAEEPEKELSELVARVKSGLACEAYSPTFEAWREIVEPSEKPGILGTLGGYEVIDVIATGAMGIVLKGFDPKLDRLAAIKILSPEAASNSTARERFLREARAGAQLEHENILPIYEVCEEAIPWFAMRYVDGGNLQDRLDAGEIYDSAALRSIGRQIALALATAHEKGMIHRDIKPGNILLSRDGEQVWVADFGIVRCTEDPSLTYPGAIAGTPKFMSPEQAAGADLDERSDLFSFGLVLFLCATGRHPLAGKTTAAVISELTGGKRLMTRHDAGHLPQWMQRLVCEMLEHDPDDRPSTARAIAEAMESGAFSQAAHGSRRIWIGTALVATAAILPCLAIFASGKQSTIQGFVLVEETGQRFEDLAVALESVSEKSTLVLSGDFELNRALWLKYEVRLVAAAGTRPTVFVHLQDEHGIYFFRPFTASGIRFVRPEGTIHSLPIIGGNFSEGACIIEDCEFVVEENSEGAPTLGRCLGFTAASGVIVRDCVFDSPGGSGLFLATQANQEESTAVRVEECLFKTRTAIEVLSWESPGKIEISLARNVIVCDSLLYRSAGKATPGVSMDLTDNFLGARSNIVLIYDVGPEVLRDSLEWNGDGNTYFRSVPWLVSAPRELSKTVFPGTMLRTRQEMAKNASVFSDVNINEISLPVDDVEGSADSFTQLMEKLEFPPDSPVQSVLLRQKTSEQ